MHPWPGDITGSQRKERRGCPGYPRRPSPAASVQPSAALCRRGLRKHRGSARTPRLDDRFPRCLTGSPSTPSDRDSGEVWCDHAAPDFPTRAARQSEVPHDAGVGRDRFWHRRRTVSGPFSARERAQDRLWTPADAPRRRPTARLPTRSSGHPRAAPEHPGGPGGRRRSPRRRTRPGTGDPARRYARDQLPRLAVHAR